jgi:hypothetical protein
MTETPEPAPADETPAAEPDRQADPTVPQRRSLFGSLNRINRIAALVLGGVATVFAAVLLFCAGVLVGAEHGESRGDRHVSEEYGQQDGDKGESADYRAEDEPSGDGEEDDVDEAATDGDQGGSDESSRSGATEGPPPSQSNAPPRP